MGYNPISGFNLDADDYSFNNQDFLILTSAGNSGSSGNSGTIGQPGSSKNVLTVGAQSSSTRSWASTSCGLNGPSPCEQNVADFSSKGPMPDGRIGPDVIAIGDRVKSALSDPNGASCGDVFFSGTSMATPITAGIAALVRQYFVDGYYPNGISSNNDKFTPMGALVKAVIIQSTQRLTGEYRGQQIPTNSISDDFTGFGAVAIGKILPIPGGDAELLNFYAVGDYDNMVSLSTGENYDESIIVNDVSNDLIITLVWHDYVGSSVASKALSE